MKTTNFSLFFFYCIIAVASIISIGYQGAEAKPSPSLPEDVEASQHDVQLDEEDLTDRSYFAFCRSICQQPGSSYPSVDVCISHECQSNADPH